jgi:SNF2 family DNA or RNA helicase
MLGYLAGYLARRWIARKVLYSKPLPPKRPRVTNYMKAFAELSKDGRRIEVYFNYSPGAVAAIREIPGAGFTPVDRGGPYWRVPLDLTTAQRLRECFGPGLTLGNALKAWGRTEVQKQRNLRTLTRANDADLKRLPKLHEDLFKYVSTRPYQRADIALMAETNVLNANQPGTGKTIETIGSWFESDLIYDGPHLVIAPVRSLVNVWEDELAWTGLDIYTAEDPAERYLIVQDGLQRAAQGEAVIVCVNPAMIRGKKLTADMENQGLKADWVDIKGNGYVYANELQKLILTVQWATCTIDEFHKMGLNNRWSLLSQSLARIVARKRAALSGTPMGGIPRKLWAILNWLEPGEYTSEWRWINMWLEVDDNGYGKKVGGIIPGREDAFYEAHARHMCRRMKREALPGLPDQVHITVMCSMTKGQKAQYVKFGQDAEIRIDEQRLASTSVLAEYARLKQFANAKQRLDGGVPYPTEDSGKLEMLLEKLDEEGVRKDDPEPGVRAIVASESSRMVHTISQYLTKHGIANDTMTGETKDTKALIKKFKDAKNRSPYVIVMTVQTGGVSLNLEEADSMHAFDETWNPDDLEQFFDRADRGSRTTPLKCYTYRTRDTIQEYIAEVNEGKKITNKNILDIRRMMNKNKNQDDE